MTYLSELTGYLILIGFGLVMLVISYTAKQINKSSEAYLLANRQIGLISGANSIAASWLWAPALFISVQATYQNGIAGLFWFTVPNILALMLFSILGPRIRQLLPTGYTLPQFIKQKLGNKVHKLYLIPFCFYQLMAITVQLFVGGGLITTLTGINIWLSMSLMLIIALSYTWLGGFKASANTDALQLGLIFIAGLIILPLTWRAGGGWEAIQTGLNGINQVNGIWDTKVAFNFGIVTSIGLLAGAICDQQYWQRVFALKTKLIKPAFILGALLFGLVPIGLSILGFLAANPQLSISLPTNTDPSLIGVITIATLLPTWATTLFFVALLAGLSSTLDSALIATSSLWHQDFMARSNWRGLSMLAAGLTGLILAWLISILPNFGLQQLWWLFNTIAACVAGPTILSLYKENLKPQRIFWSIVITFSFGLPLFIYSNLISNSPLIIATSIGIISFTTLPHLTPRSSV